MSIQNALSFLKLRSTPGEIRRITQKKFKICLVGSPDFTSSFREVITRGMKLDVPAENAESQISEFIQVLSMPVDETARKSLKADMIIYLLNSEDATRDNFKNYRDLYKLKPPAHLFVEEPATNNEKENLYRIMDDLFLSSYEWIAAPSEESICAKAEIILNINTDINMALAYRFPILRQAMARKLIHNTSMQNMTIALASSLPTSLPIIGIIIGLLAVTGETTVLTINQLKLCMQLAGIYGLEMNLAERIKELWPLVGSALGFRTIARSLVGFLPVAGFSIKGGVAYTGTYIVGETVRWFYEKGRKLTTDERQRIILESQEKAVSYVEQYLKKLKIRISSVEKKEEKIKKAELEKEPEKLEPYAAEIQVEESTKEEESENRMQEKSGEKNTENKVTGN